MIKSFPLFILLIVVTSILSACGGASPTPPSTAVPAAPATLAIAQPTDISVSTAPAAQTAPTQAATAVGSDQAIPSGITADRFYYLGNPDAPVTLIDYSDFL